VDDLTCQAVLFGGVDFDYHSGNSTGNVRWNDTWVLNLAHRSWRELKTVNTPPSLADAGFLFDNASDIFLLYGGCDSLCSTTIWQFNQTGRNWIARPPTSFAPPGRGGADWVYSPTYDVAVLSMGFELVGNTVVPLNDTYIYEIDLNRFDAVGPPTPTPRYDAAGGWLGANGCPGFLLVGGNLAPTDPPDQWFLDPAPDVPLACNTWGNDSISVGGGGYDCVNGFELTVTVTNLSGGPIAGANVTAAGNCSKQYQITGPNGQAYFDLTYQPYIITARAAGYHENSTPFQASNTSVAGTVNLTLTPLPTLILHSFGQPLTGPAIPLANVTISGVDGSVLGVTNDTGVLTIVGFDPTGEFYTFLANCTGYSDAQNLSRIPFSGNWSVDVTLLAPGPIDVQVVEAGAGTPLPGAVVTVQTISTEAPAGFQRLGNPDGWANATAVQGNYTATATLAGYVQFSFVAPFFHPWKSTTVIRLNMTSNAGYTVNVRVLDRTDAEPIPGSTVQVGVYPPEYTSPSGWMNLTGVKPAGTYGVTATAENYSTNHTFVILSYYRPIWVLTLNLTPLEQCSATNTGPNCTRTPLHGVTVQPLTLWPSSPPTLTALIAGGALLFLVPSAFLFLARRRPPRGAQAPGAP
jgi:hypothetical protein